MKTLVLAFLLLATLGAVNEDPTMVCSYSKAVDDISGRWEGGFPTQIALKVRLKGFDLPAEAYDAKLSPRCNIVYDADVPLPNGEYRRVICGPVGVGSVTCGGWTP